jgi:NTP pyrophosphatase (non-canonical NTP hydrolase)
MAGDAHLISRVLPHGALTNGRVSPHETYSTAGALSIVRKSENGAASSPDRSARLKWGPYRHSGHSSIMNIQAIQNELETFAAERDWNQFHSPKNLAMALSVEVSELLEHFQWLTQEQSARPDAGTLGSVATEIADIQIYLLRLADKLGIDIESAVELKMQDNERKYPADRVRGSAAKYTEYE